MNLKGFYSSGKALLGILHGSRAFGGPVQAILSLGSKCNMRCIHCYYYSPYLQGPVHRVLRAGEIHNQSDMSEDIQMELVEELLNIGVYNFVLSGDGEFLLNKNCMDIMERLKKSSSKCILNTNGTLLTKDMIDKLIKIKFDELRITVMAGTAEMYLLTHPGVKEDIFYNLKENLIYLAEKKKELGVKKPEATLVYIVISENYNGIFNFAEFAHSVKADRLLYRPFDDVDDAGLKKFIPSEKQSDHIIKELMKVKDFLLKTKVKQNIASFLKAFRGKIDTTELYRFIPCYYPWLASMIDINGNVYPCCRCYTPVGNIHKNSFRKIWFGNSYRELRKEALQINERQKSVKDCYCNSCVHFIPNIRVYQLLNPLKARSTQFKSLCRHLSEGDE